MHRRRTRLIDLYSEVFGENSPEHENRLNSVYSGETSISFLKQKYTPLSTNGPSWDHNIRFGKFRDGGRHSNRNGVFSANFPWGPAKNVFQKRIVSATIATIALGLATSDACWCVRCCDGDSSERSVLFVHVRCWSNTDRGHAFRVSSSSSSSSTSGGREGVQRKINHLPRVSRSRGGHLKITVVLRAATGRRNFPEQFLKAYKQKVSIKRCKPDENRRKNDEKLRTIAPLALKLQ